MQITSLYSKLKHELTWGCVIKTHLSLQTLAPPSAPSTPQNTSPLSVPVFLPCMVPPPLNPGPPPFVLLCLPVMLFPPVSDAVMFSDKPSRTPSRRGCCAPLFLSSLGVPLVTLPTLLTIAHHLQWVEW